MSRLLKCQVEPCGAAAVRALLCALMLVCPELLLGQASGGAPMIVNQPQNQFVLAGGTAAFSVTVNGQQPFFYQWFGPRGQAPDGKIADATNATLKTSPVRTNDQGNYSVKVTNQFGMTQSGPATLTVMEVDFGDAPSPYPTLFADNGAQHQIVQGIQL